MRLGKTLAVEKALTDYIKLHPDAVIIRFKQEEVIIEKPVKASSIKKLEASK